MITKSRLVTLVNKQAKIYYLRDFKFVRDLDLSNYYLYYYDDCEQKEDNIIGLFNLDDFVPVENFHLLFETKAEAEWYRDFGYIERTEYLTLPDWNHAVKELTFISAKGEKYIFETKIKVGYSVDKENPYIIRISKVGYSGDGIDFEYTEDNYIRACQYVKDLYLGD